MPPQPEIAKELINQGITGIVEYVMPITAILAIMAIFGLRIVLFNSERTKNYILYSVGITFVLISTAIVLKQIKEDIAEHIISIVSTIIFVLFIIQVIIQLKLKKK